jgi:hypothetical protein
MTMNASPVAPRRITEPVSSDDILTLDDLRHTGLLWLINTTLFHPRGFALALVMRDGKAVGWRMLGDGSEPWMFNDADGAIDRLFQAAEAFLNSRRKAPQE